MRRITLAVFIIAISAVTLAAQRGRKPVNYRDLPEPFATPSVRNNASVVPGLKAPRSPRRPGSSSRNSWTSPARGRAS